MITDLSISDFVLICNRFAICLGVIAGLIFWIWICEIIFGSRK